MTWPDQCKFGYTSSLVSSFKFQAFHKTSVKPDILLLKFQAFHKTSVKPDILLLNFRHSTRADEEIPAGVQLQPIPEMNKIKFNPIYISNNDYLNDEVHI